MAGNFPNYHTDFLYGRFFFDNLYNIIILIIFMQIFSGIIIDTFGSLRDLQQIKNKDRDEICFICGFSREEFDRKSEIGFNKHIKN